MLESQIDQQTNDVLRDVKVIPAYKCYKPDGHYWVAKSKPVPYYTAVAWLQKNVQYEHNTTKGWVGPPDVKLIKSRGLVDHFLNHPDLPKNALYK